LLSAGITEYLQQAYETLLRSNGILLDTLEHCAAATAGTTSSDTPSKHHRSAHSRDEHDDDLPTTDLPDPAYGDATEHINCLEQAGYNLILRPQYMLLVPRSRKDFASAVNINSFGE
jgi:hypothetical protein